jgi:hypothetical protein
MKTVSTFSSKNDFFEASYSIQLSYGCASRQVPNFIALTINTYNAFLRLLLSLIHPQKPAFGSCELWEICGDSSCRPEPFRDLLIDLVSA